MARLSQEKQKNMLSSENGWYDKGRELFFFKDYVHVMTEDQEGWCDSLFFNRMTSDVEMLGNAQVTDTTRNVFAVAGRIEYQDSLSKVTLTRDPAVISQVEEQDSSIDTVYLGADKLVYMTIPMFKVDSMAVVFAERRLKDLDVDPVGEYRKKAAEAAAKAMEEAVENDPNLAAKKAAQEKKKTAEKKAEREKMPLKQEIKPAVKDSLALSDTLAVADSLAVTDSLAVADSIAAVPPVDSTKVGFLEAIRNVRIFKKNMQVRCDSLLYSDLDSLARLFKEPLIWQEQVRQYSADSVSIVIRNGSMDKASLMSNAFITIEEIISFPAIQNIITGSAINIIITFSGIHCVIAFISVNDIITITSVYTIITAKSIDYGIINYCLKHIITFASVNMSKRTVFIGNMHFYSLKFQGIVTVFLTLAEILND